VLASEPEARTGTGTGVPIAIDSIDSNGENLAYIIYTSGSTGEPKGVEISQRNLRNLIDWHIGAFGIGPGDRVSCQAGLSFDAVVWELFPALSCGAAVHLAEDQVRTSSDELRRWLVAEKITVAFVPTTLAEPLITSDWPAETRLRTMLTGGDTLHVWPKPGLPFAVVNNYGPSECTVVATSGIVADRATPGGMPTIGRPIANSEIHILDATGRPVPHGQVGEIHMGGANVGRGYRHRPSLSAQAFVTREGVGRLYRTGDLGCWTDDGEVAFHGRCDEQVKVRGYRVEPNEISAALDRHPAVLQSAVVAEGDRSARRLVAYLVPATGQALYGGELRDFLALTLPAYMLPDVFVRLASLPLTAHGKLDRAALPRPTAANTVRGSRHRAPHSDVERRIATLIEDLLGIERVGADDNFFLLGGHSLLGTQLVLRLREAFGAELRLRDLFEGPTVAKLAKRVEQAVISAVSSMDEEEVRRRLIH
jgi:amino acid adenylation domain-containing protein